MNKPNYELKAYILRDCKELLDYVNKCKRADYIKYQLEENGLVLNMPNSDKELMTINDLKLRYIDYGKLYLVKECLKINKANSQRVKRLENRIKTIISQNESTFLTLTFTDKALRETSAKTRRVMITRFLKDNNCPYIANIDFGVDKTKTMREHYHAVVGSQAIDYSKWPYGCVNGKRIILKNDKALAKYVSKLTNHAIKEQAKRSSLIYSR